MVKNSDEEKYIYSGYRIKFDNAGLWSFGNGSAKNVIISGIDNNSTSDSEIAIKTFKY